jgi:hypothetical protein
MSIRANIELYDGWEQRVGQGSVTKWRQGAMLYRHRDGHPSRMGPELERVLQAVKQELETALFPFWRDSKRVATLMVKSSASGFAFYKGGPRFGSCFDLHADTDFVWRVFLGPEDGVYDIQCFKLTYDWDRGVIKHLASVDWRQEIERQPGR